MKKIYSIMMAAITSASIFSAQNVLAADSDDEINHNGLFIETTLGAGVGDIKTDFGADISFGYRYSFGSGINWDILKVGAYDPVITSAEDVEKTIGMRFLTGARYNSAPVIADKSLYGNFGVGYFFIPGCTESNGFSYEVGAGVNLSRSVSLGASWEGFKPKASHYGIIGVKFSYLF